MKPSFPFFGRPKPVDRAGPPEWLIAGLGNPGRNYADNRHNAGFHVIDRVAENNHLTFDERRSQAHLARGQVEGVRVVLVKPQTYMNLSGKAVSAVARFFKVPPARILVIFDDLDLPLGTIRLRLRGGAGGHKGVTSIIAYLNTNDFPRLRVGIGRPPDQMPPQVYVLQDFKDEEKPTLEHGYQQAVEAIHVTMRTGFEMAMNQFNQR